MIDLTKYLHCATSGDMDMRVVQDRCASCGMCADICDIGAIQFTERDFNGQHYSHAVIDEALCVGCGDCCDVCPVNAIMEDGA